MREDEKRCLEQVFWLKEDDAYRDNQGKTALMIGAKYCKAYDVSLLLRQAPNIDLEDDHGMTALRW